MACGPHLELVRSTERHLVIRVLKNEFTPNTAQPMNQPSSITTTSSSAQHACATAGKCPLPNQRNADKHTHT